MDKEMELPEGWTSCKLGEVCQFEYGKGLVKGDRNATGDFDVYGSNGIVGKHSQYLIGQPCIIIGRKGAAGVVHLSLKPSWPIDTTYFIKGNDKFILKFLYYQLTVLGLAALETSTAIPGLNRNDAYAKSVVLPPINEQHQIVEKIEELFSELDKGIENLKTAQQQLKVYRQAVLKWAFEGKLTNEHVKDGELPEGWEWKKISNLCDVVRGGSPRPAGDPKFYDGNIPFLKVADLTKGDGVYLSTFKYTIKEAGLTKTRKIKPNTLLLSNSGATLGVPKICIIDATMNDGIAAFLNLDIRSNHYLYYFWLSKTRELRNINMGAAQPNLNTDIIKDYNIPYCSFEEQQIVVDALESRLSVCDKIEETISTNLQQAEALRQSILKKAFEGKLFKSELPK
nr:restriction endonuclease subunit S [uncultured Mucilaginibacter sp.]